MISKVKEKELLTDTIDELKKRIPKMADCELRELLRLLADIAEKEEK